MSFTKSELDTIKNVAVSIKVQLNKKYGMKYENLMGKCIEASDTLVEKLKLYGFNAEAKQVWCLYENFETCSNYCYEEHWIVKVTKGRDKVFIDLTIKQFQWAFFKELPSIYFSNKLPNFFLTRKPGKTTLDKCGWNDWYNYGNYVNNFNYWGE